MSYQTWVKTQLSNLDDLAEFGSAEADDLRSLIYDAEYLAAESGLPGAVQVCQIRDGGIGIGLARRILSACLEACQYHEPPSMLTPPLLAREWGVSRDKVLTWIRSGRLKAKNVSRGHQPRYLIARADAEAFQPGYVPEPTPQRSRRTKPKMDIIEYF